MATRRWRRIGVAVTLLVLLASATALNPALAADEGSDPMAQLRSLVPPELKGTCERLRPQDMTIKVRGAVAALVCAPPGPIEDVGLYLFERADRLEQWWLERLGMIEQRLGPADCEQGVAGVESRLGGQMVCYQDRGVARIRWIDQERLLYGSLDMTRPAIAPAYARWAETLAPCCGPTRRSSDPEVGPNVTWRRQDQAPGWPIGLEVDLATPSLSAVALAPDGAAVLLGSSTYTPGPLAWYAPDGMDWTRVKLAGLLKGLDPTGAPSGKTAEPRDVAAWDGGFVAVGDADSETRHVGAVWTSDSGTEWAAPDRIDGAGLRQVLVTDEGLAVVGVAGRQREDGRGIPTLWTSPDGRTWNAQLISDQPAWVGSAARSPGGVWLVRGTGAWRSEGDSRLWRSVDGVTWDELAPPMQDGSGDLLRLVGPVWTPTGFVLGANAVDGEGRHTGSQLWHSPDGLTWTAVAASEGAVGNLAGGPGVSVAFPAVNGADMGSIKVPKGTAGPAVMLTSQDGRTWCRADSASFAASSVISSDVNTDGVVLAAGDGGRWGGLPRTWQGEPTTPGSVDCTPAATPPEATTFTLAPVVRDAPRALKTVADLEASPRRTVTFDRLMADLEPLLYDPAAQAVALERYWDWWHGGDLTDCSRTDGDDRYYACSGLLDGAVSIYHYAPSERSWRFVRDAYDFLYAEPATPRTRRFLHEGAIGSSISPSRSTPGGGGRTVRLDRSPSACPAGARRRHAGHDDLAPSRHDRTAVHRAIPLLALLTTLALALALTAAPAAAAADRTCQVTNTATSQTCGRLQRAVDLASAGDRLIVTGLCLGRTLVTRDLVIKGVPSAELGRPILDGQLEGRYGVARVRVGVEVRIHSLTIRRGLTNRGGGIRNAGVLTLRGVVVRDNSAHEGGGIYNRGTLILTGDTRIVRNTATGGGGVTNRGMLTMAGNSRIARNTALTGGGLWNEGPPNGVICAPAEGANVVRNSPDDCVVTPSQPASRAASHHKARPLSRQFSE